MLIKLSMLAAITLVLPMLAFADGGQIYKWVDEDGKVHFSDCPPPPECAAEQVVKAPLPSAEEAARARRKLDQMIEEQEASYNARKKQKEEREARRIEALQLAVDIKRQCASSRQSLHVLSKPRPVYSIDDEGEYVYLSAEERKAEIKRLETFIAEQCEEN